MNCSEKLSADGIRCHLRGSFGGEMMVWDQVDSTNSEAKLLAKNGAPHGTAVFARQQTAGKGRLGRSFFSPPDAGLYMSVILRPRLTGEQTLPLTCGTAVAVSKAIQTVCAVEPRIKWVNDLYAERKKLCGILAEAALGSNGCPQYVIMGIGINISIDSFPLELEEKATCLSRLTGETVNRNRLAGEVLNCLEDIVEGLDTQSFLSEYKRRSCVLGNQVKVIGSGEPYMATAVDIDENGWLHVVDEQGQKQILNSGEISLKGAFL